MLHVKMLATFMANGTVIWRQGFGPLVHAAGLEPGIFACLKWIPVMEVIGCPFLFRILAARFPSEDAIRKGYFIFQPLIFRGKLLVLGRVNNFCELFNYFGEQ